MALKFSDGSTAETRESLSDKHDCAWCYERIGQGSKFVAWTAERTRGRPAITDRYCPDCWSEMREACDYKPEVVP